MGTFRERGAEKSRSIKKQIRLSGTQSETRSRFGEKVKSGSSLLEIWTCFNEEASGGVQVTCQVFQITLKIKIKIVLQISHQVCVTDAIAILEDISHLKLYVNSQTFKIADLFLFLLTPTSFHLNFSIPVYCTTTGVYIFLPIINPLFDFVLPLSILCATPFGAKAINLAMDSLCNACSHMGLKQHYLKFGPCVPITSA